VSTIIVQSIRRAIGIVLLTATCGYAFAELRAHPLAPPDLSSPRATLSHFLTHMDRVYARWKADDSTDDERAERAAIARIAQEFFDLHDIAPSVRRNVGRETAVYMKEILDRIDLPPWEQIPDAQMVAAKDGFDQWTVPETEITLVRLAEGLHKGQWVFSSETDERAPEFYRLVEHLPYKPGASDGLYRLFVSQPGWMIPRSLIHALPDWMHTRHGGQAIWQWCALVLTLLVTAAAMVVIYRVAGRLSRRHRGTGYYLSAVFPIFAVVVPQLATDFLSDQVFITGRLFEILDFALDLISLAALVVVILGLTSRLANGFMALPWSKERQLTAQLAQLIVRAIGITCALIAVFEGGRYLGVPLTTLVAGVSVSGLTVALAAQDTLKNLFGSVMILLDRPFQVGDRIHIKGHEGKVESIGLRSTRIRDANGHVISISNEEMARLDSKNISSRRHSRRHEVVRLRPDTPPQKVRGLAEFIRGILQGRDGLDVQPPPSVRIGFGDAAVTVTMTYHYGSANSAAFAAFNEEITLAILERMQQDGIELARAGHVPHDGEAAQEHTAPHVHQEMPELHEPRLEAESGAEHRPEHPT
jgi:MscS family membrane protein